MSNDVILLLVGAGIALVSSLATAAFTALLKYWLDSRAKTAEKTEEAYRLIGRMSVIITKGKDQVDWVAIWEKHSRRLDEFLRVSKRDPNKLAGIIGLIETGLEQMEELQEKVEEKEEKVKQLEEEQEQLTTIHQQLVEKVGLLEEKVGSLREERNQLEEEHEQLETTNRELKEQLKIEKADEG
jgi:chromosome segregation ATPase